MSLRRRREAGIVGGQIDLADEGVGRLDALDDGQGQLLGQAVLQGAEGAFRPAARFGRIGRDMLDPQLRERPPDLGDGARSDLPAGLGSPGSVRPGSCPSGACRR